jgi:iron(III) transport system permease protein
LKRNLLPLGLIGVLGYLVLVPLIRLQALALHDGGRAYGEALDTRNFAQTVQTTLALAFGSLVMALVVGTMLAWFATRLPHRLRWLGLLPILPIVIPPVASVIGWAFLLAPKTGILNGWLRELPLIGGSPEEVLPSGPIDIYTPLWIILITGLYLTSFMYVFIRAGLARLSFDLTEAARVAGASPSRAFFQVVLPLIRPSLLYGGAIALLLGLGQFTAPLLLGLNHGVRVLTMEVYRFASESPDYGLAAALASPLLIAGLVLVILQRVLLGNSERFVSDVGKGVQGAARPSRLAPLVIVLYASVTVVLPLLALGAVSLSPFWTGKLDPSLFSLENFRTLFETPQAIDAVTTSVIVSIGGVLVALPVGYLAAEVIHRRRGGRVARTLMELIITVPLGVPAVVFGAGFLYMYTREPTVLYGTRWVIVLVYVTLMLPFTTRLQLAARISLGDSYEAAARASGAGPLRTHLTILLPLMRASLGGAAALMFVLLSHEFAASLLVRSTDTQVMGTVLYDYWTNSGYTLVAAMAVVMCLVTAVGVAIAGWLGGANTLNKL